MSDKIQIAIYSIKSEIKEMVQQKPVTTAIDIAYLTKLLKKKKFKSQDINAKLSKEYGIHLFFKRTRTKILWKDFIRVIAKPNSPILSNDKNSNESYVILLEDTKTHKIYATTGGYGHTALQGVIESDFGLEILSRIIKADDRTIRASKEKNLTGGILGEIKFFRNNYNLNENENFGNFYQELHSSLNQDLLKKFGFSQDDIDSDKLCIAKSSFTIKKAISFEQLLVIIRSCESLLKNTVPVVEINSVKKLGKSEQILINDLERQIENACYEEYSGTAPGFEIELCHQDFDKYLNATQFTFTYRIGGIQKNKLYQQPIKKLNTILEDVKSNSTTLSQNELIQLLNRATIESNDSDGNLMTIDSLEKHFSTEIQYNHKSYFLYEKDWFEIKADFIHKLNTQCADFINRNWYRGILQTWNLTESEDLFNGRHIGVKDTIVLHKITPQNIEACDILQWDSNSVYFIHVKRGFDNSMRDLVHQVLIAARRLNEDMRTGMSFLKMLFSVVNDYSGQDTYRKKVKNQLNGYTENSFLKLFQNRKLVLVLAVQDTATKKRSLKDINQFDSNIAKFSLSELIKSLRAINVDFQIYEL